MGNQKKFELMSHTADLCIRIYGSTLEELFKHAVIGMFQVIGPHAQGCQQKDERLVCPTLPCKRIIEARGHDHESLLVDFLSQALAASDIYNEAYLDAQIQSISANSLTALMLGVPITRFDLEIKAVTHNDLVIKQRDNIWQVDIVFDI